MTQYTRPDSLPAWAESGDTVQPTNPEIQTGWPSSTVPPSRQRFNWVLNYVANAVRYFMQRGVAEWNADEDYPQYGRCSYNGITYRALINQPTSFPGDVAGEWEVWGYTESTIQARTDSVLSKSVAGAVDVTLTSAEAGNGILLFTGALTGNINVIVPNSARRWTVINNTSGSFTLGLKTSAGAAVQVDQSKAVSAYCDGANTVGLSGAANTVAVSVQQFTATAGQTTFTISGGYVAGTVNLVTRNGSDVPFTASNGTTVVLGTAATLNDLVKVYIFAGFTVSGAVSKSGDTMTGALTLSGDPTSALHAAPKQYVDAAVSFATSIAASCASNAMTITLQPCSLKFRSPTLTNGAPVTAVISSPLTVTIPTSATLGTVNNTAARFVAVCYYNGGTPVLGVINLAGGAQLDETNLVSPTTISSGATSNSTHYSASSVGASSPYRIVGFVDNTQTTAGTYAAQPSVVQGQGGQALAAMASLGYGQTWQVVTGSRAANTTYYNTTGKPIMVSLLTGNSGNIVVGGNNAAYFSGTVQHAGSAIVPPGMSYSSTMAFTQWTELR